MDLNIQVKQPGKKGRHIMPKLLHYERCPETVRQLIEETVRLMVADFRERLKAAKEGQSTWVYTEEKLSAMAEMGKVAFGDIWNEKEPDEEKAIATAWQAYADGMVRVFVNGMEAEYSEDGTELGLKDGDEITFVRLAMLAGRMF